MGKTSRDFRELQVRRKAHALAVNVYKASHQFPVEERFGITSQLRRAGASIPTNIAEGVGRGGDADLARFLRIAMGSASEVEYLLLLARDLDYLDVGKHDTLSADVIAIKRMLTSFIRKLKAEG